MGFENKNYPSHSKARFKDIKTEWWSDIIRSGIEYWKVPEDLLKNILEDLPEGASILDLGCGDGNLIESLSKLNKDSGKNFKITGADISEEIIDNITKKKLTEAGVSGVDYSIVNIIKQDIPKKFDVVFMKFVLGCLRDEKYSSQEDLFNDVLEKVKKSCNCLVLITTVLKEGIDPESVQQIFMHGDVLNKLMNKHFEEVKQMETNEEKKEFYCRMYLLKNPKNKL